MLGRAIFNPARLVSGRFDVRNLDSGLGGRFSFNNFFSGPDVGLFGGFSHRLKDYPLTFIAEYNPDQYDFDVRKGGTRPSSPISFGISWDALPGVVVTASHQHGDEFGVSFQFAADSTLSQRRAPDNFISVTTFRRKSCHLRFVKIGGIQDAL